MPLLRNTIQPFFPDPDSPAPIICGEQYCNKVASGDIVTQEFYQRPCAGNLVDDPLFEESTIGTELLTNGDFGTCPGAWTLTGNWVCGSGKITHTVSGGTDLASQTVAITSFDYYQIITVVSGYGGGSVDVILGGSPRTQYTASGTFTNIIQAFNLDSDIAIEASPDFIGNIESISLKHVTYGKWEDNDTWLLFDGKAYKQSASIFGTLYNLTTDYIASGDRYVISFEVSGYGGSGSVSAYVDDGTGSTATNIQAAVTANGVYTYYITASQNGVIGFAPTTAFIGAISSPSVRRLRNDFPFQLIDSGGASVDISDQIEYDEDKVIMNVDFADLLHRGIISDYGCYTIGVTDACLISGDNIITDGDFNRQDFTEWTRNMLPYQYNYTGTGIEFIFEPLEGPNLVTNGDFASGTSGWTFGANWAVSGGGAQHTPGSTAAISQTITLGTIPPFPQTLFTWYQITISSHTAGSVVVNIGGTNSVAYNVNDTITNKMLLAVTGSQTLTITPSSNFDGTIDDIKVHQTLNAWNNYPQISHSPTTALIAGNYNVDLTITSNIQDGVTGIYAQLDNPFPAFMLTTGANSVTINNYTPSLQMLRLSGYFTTASGYYKVGRIAIDDVSVYAVEPFQVTYSSECFNFQETHPDTVLVTGWCDQDALGSEYVDSEGVTYNDNIGFASTGSIIQMRLEVRSFNPVTKTVGDNEFYSNGSAKEKYAQLEKYWQLTTDYLSEPAHTALSAIIRCDHFSIGDAGVDATQYIAEMEDYTPQWRSEGDSNLSIANMSIRKKTGGMKFMRHV